METHRQMESSCEIDSLTPIYSQIRESFHGHAFGTPKKKKPDMPKHAGLRCARRSA